MLAPEKGGVVFKHVNYVVECSVSCPSLIFRIQKVVGLSSPSYTPRCLQHVLRDAIQISYGFWKSSAKDTHSDAVSDLSFLFEFAMRLIRSKHLVPSLPPKKVNSQSDEAFLERRRLFGCEISVMDNLRSIRQHS